MQVAPVDDLSGLYGEFHRNRLIRLDGAGAAPATCLGAPAGELVLTRRQFQNCQTALVDLLVPEKLSSFFHEGQGSVYLLLLNPVQGIFQVG